MIKKKKFFWSILGIAIICPAIYAAIGIFDYLEYKNVAISSSGMPWQDGGKITMVREPCILDTPASSPTTCAISCPLVTSVWATACTGYIEIDTKGQQGITFIAAPVGFQYKGGGAHPVAGMDFLYGGASNAQPWVIGIPSAAASRAQRLVGAFNFVMAGFKDNLK